MASVKFEVVRKFDLPSQLVWDELIDWAGHAAWVPMTRVKVEPGDPTAVGARFTAWTGLGPLALEDRMEVTELEWDPTGSSGRCEVVKHGPVLKGRAGFTIEPTGAGCTLRWIEDVTVPLVPQVLAPVVARLGAAGFSQGLRSLDKVLRSRSGALPR